MRIINRYIGQDLLRNFGFTLLVLTFVMCIGSVVKAIDYLSRGAPGALMVKSFLYIIPYMLTFTIPVALMVSVVLLLNRLSQDGELTAMKACGLSLWQISAPIVVISILICGVSIYNNAVLAPNSHFAERKLFANTGQINPVDLLEEGRFVRDFPGLVVYVGSKHDNHIEDIILYELDGQEVRRKIRAQSGDLTLDKEAGVLLVELFQAQIMDADQGEDGEEARYVQSASYTDRIDIRQLQSRKEPTKRDHDFTLSELLYAIRNIRQTHPSFAAEDLSKACQSLLVEAHQRLTLGFSCVSFALLAIGLGVREQRSGASTGILLSLLVVFINYFFIVFAQSITGHPELKPELLPWIPVLAGQAGGVWLIRRRN